MRWTSWSGLWFPPHLYLLGDLGHVTSLLYPEPAIPVGSSNTRTPGACQNCRLSGPTPDLWSRNLCRGSPAMRVFTQLPVPLSLNSAVICADTVYLFSSSLGGEIKGKEVKGGTVSLLGPGSPWPSPTVGTPGALHGSICTLSAPQGVWPQLDVSSIWSHSSLWAPHHAHSKP